MSLFLRASDLSYKTLLLPAAVVVVTGGGMRKNAL